MRLREKLTVEEKVAIALELIKRERIARRDPRCTTGSVTRPPTSCATRSSKGGGAALSRRRAARRATSSRRGCARSRSSSAATTTARAPRGRASTARDVGARDGRMPARRVGR